MPTKEEVDKAIEVIMEYQKTLTDEKRVELWHDFMEDYCEVCGSKYPPCYCWNDD
jgi:hypothetical protein